MTPVELMLTKLPNAKKNTNGWSARCPAHHDRQPSLSISTGDDGRVLLHCHAGCDPLDVLAAVGLQWSDTFPPEPPTKKPKSKPNSPAYKTANDAVKALECNLGTHTAIWTYCNAVNEPVGLVVRFDVADQKTYRPIVKHEDGWRIAAMDTPRPLYQLPKLKDAAVVIVTEGEKAADAAISLGFVATTAAGGSKAADKSDWSPLAGKEVWIIPDNDQPGEEYAKEVSGILASLKPSPVSRIVKLPGLPLKGDIVEWIEAHGEAAEVAGMRDELTKLARSAQPCELPNADSIPAPKGSERARIELIPASQLGRGDQVNWLWQGWIAKGHITLLVGLWKAGKTTLLSHLLKGFSHGGDIAGAIHPAKVVVVAEEGQGLWARRRDDMGFDDNVQFIIRPFKGRPSPKAWAEYVEELAAIVRDNGINVVMIDTWQSVSPSPDENDAAGTMAALSPLHHITETGAAILLIHHSKKGDDNEGKVSRGSGALPGFVDIIVELRRFNAEEIDDKRRKLRSYSRFDETPGEVVLELTEGCYRAVGSIADASREDRIKVYEEILSAGNWMTSEEVREKWPDGGIVRPGKRTVDTDLKHGAECIPPLWSRKGEGCRGDPYRYGFNSRTPTV